MHTHLKQKMFQAAPFAGYKVSNKAGFQVLEGYLSVEKTGCKHCPNKCFVGCMEESGGDIKGRLGEMVVWCGVVVLFHVN